MQTHVSESKSQITGLLTKSQLQVLGQNAALEQKANKRVNLNGETDECEEYHLMRSLHATNSRRHIICKTNKKTRNQHCSSSSLVTTPGTLILHQLLKAHCGHQT